MICSGAHFDPAVTFGGSDGYNLTTRCVRGTVDTFVLVLTVGLNVLANSPAGAWSNAASLTCMIYALGDRTGAHLDPAAVFGGSDGYT